MIFTLQNPYMRKLQHEFDMANILAMSQMTLMQQKLSDNKEFDYNSLDIIKSRKNLLIYGRFNNRQQIVQLKWRPTNDEAKQNDKNHFNHLLYQLKILNKISQKTLKY